MKILKGLERKIRSDKFDAGRYPVDYTSKFRCPLCNEVHDDSAGQFVKLGDGRNIMICKKHKKIDVR